HIPGRVCINKRNVYREGIGYDEFIAPPGEYEKLAVPFEQRPEPKISWVSKYGSITFNSEGVDFPDGGVNEKGLAVFEMSLGSTRNRYDEKNPSVFMVLWIQYVLDNFTTIDEVIESTYRINLQGWSWHYFVSDARGDCAVIEFLGGEVVVHRGEGLPYPVLCNSRYSRELERLEGYSGIKAWTADLLRKTPRFVKAARLLDRFDASAGPDAGDYARKILEEIAIKRWNKWSILVDVTNMTVYFHTDGNRRLRYFSLSGFDLDRKPAEILDIHGDGSGDVTGRFEDYTRERNLELTRERARLLFADRFRGFIDNGVTAEVYSERFAGYSERIRARDIRRTGIQDDPEKKE
ncbi:MAG TPA: linear amide C-N hydrolase, partial [Candidatus Krumholzibacterium sp.]|nr:linear amide C-N hydrolase [Candidatus Krumholzibacterium sp.]